MRKAIGLLSLALVLPFHSAWAQTTEAATTAVSIRPMALLILQLGVLVLAARLGGTLFRRWRMPGVLGELLSGVIVGPHLLGGVTVPGFPEGLMQGVSTILTSQRPLFGVVLVALTVLVFLIGLDTDIRLIRRYALAGALVGVGGAVASFVAVSALTASVSPWLFGHLMAWYEPGPFVAGVVASITSVGILARMLTGTQRLETPEGVVALSGAVVDGLVGMLLLAVGAGVVESVAAGRPATAGMIATGVVRIVLASGLLALIGLIIARKVARATLRDGNSHGSIAATAACVLVAAGLTGYCGLSPLLGAYVMGVVFSTTDLRHYIHERVEFVHLALIPACFALVGTQVNVGLLADHRVCLFVLAFVGVALVAKLVACGLAAIPARLTAAGCLRVGIVSMPRGEATLAMAMLAIAAGIMPDAVLMAVVVLLVVSGLLLPKLTEAVFKRGGPGFCKGFTLDKPVRISFAMTTADSALLIVRRLLEVFENDGFSVYVLNRREHLYRFTREDFVVTLQQTGPTLVFTCTARERNLINTVMVEIAAGIEQNLRDVRRDLDPVALQRQLQLTPSDSAPDTGNALRAFLSPEVLRPRLLSDTKTGAIDELLDVLYENDLIRDRHEARRAVFAREQNLSTGLEHGIAIPHGRTDAVDRLVCAIGLKPEGIDFGSMDDIPTRIVILVLAPQNVSAPQLQFISLISQTLNDQGRAALLTCDTSEEMLAVLSSGAADGASRKRKVPPALACLQWQNVSLDIGSGDKEEVIERLLALCARSGAVTSVDDARAAVLAREHKMSTGMEHGVALPHARTEAVSRLVCAVGISRAGVDFESLDGAPTRILVLTLVPPSVSTDYTRLMGAVMRALDREGRAALLTAKTAHEVLDILACGEQ
ncbi:MAG: PTS sugar transporter subunit IIA [Lentisphaerota bacterium]